MPKIGEDGDRKIWVLLRDFLLSTFLYSKVEKGWEK